MSCDEADEMRDFAAGYFTEPPHWRRQRYGKLVLRCSVRAALFPDRPPDPLDVAAVSAWISAQLEPLRAKV